MQKPTPTYSHVEDHGARFRFFDPKSQALLAQNPARWRPRFHIAPFGCNRDNSPRHPPRKTTPADPVACQEGPRPFRPPQVASFVCERPSKAALNLLRPFIVRILSSAIQAARYPHNAGRSSWHVQEECASRTAGQAGRPPTDSTDSPAPRIRIRMC